jgi:membrane fusion protein (multidrug efflux system)
MSCNLLISNNSSLQTIIIPYQATIEQMAEYFVYVVNADTVAQRKVLLGQRIRDMVIVKSGLQAKEIIVLDGVQKLKDGSKVHAASAVDSSTPGAIDTSKKKSL